MKIFAEAPIASFSIQSFERHGYFEILRKIPNDSISTNQIKHG